MSSVKFLKQTAASVPTPPTGYISLFWDSTDSLPKYKDEFGTVNALGSFTFGYPLQQNGNVISIPIASPNADGYMPVADKIYLTNQQNTINFSTSPQSISAATSTAINGSGLTVPSIGFTIGQTYRWKLVFTKTSAGTLASTIFIRLGTTGTISDGVVAQFSTGTATANTDTCYVEILFTVRTLGSSATAQAVMSLTHGLNTTGWANTPAVVVNGTMSSFNSNTATILSATITSGTSVVPTAIYVSAELVKQ